MTMTRSAQLSTGTLVALGMAISCLTPPAGPVPVQGAREEVRALSGQWRGATGARPPAGVEPSDSVWPSRQTPDMAR